jgi:hypothetical protein
MGKDIDAYHRALEQQREQRQWQRYQHLGPADERCPRCGEPVETLLNSEGKNPKRCCWRCEVEQIERDAERNYD